MIKKFIFFFISFIFISCDFTPTLNQQILEAQQKITQQKYDQAVVLYERIIQGVVPIDLRIKIYYQLGELCSIHLGQSQKAVNYYKKITEISDDPLWLVKVEEKIGDIYFNYLRDYKKSADVFKKLTSFTPKLRRFDYYQLMLALSYLNQNEFDQALDIFQSIQTSESNENFVKSFYYSGLIYFQKKDWVKSIQYWKEYIKREDKKDAVIQTKFLIANVYETMENLKNAYDLYYSLLGEYPNTELLQNKLKSIYERKIARKR